MADDLEPVVHRAEGKVRPMNAAEFNARMDEKSSLRHQTNERSMRQTNKVTQIWKFPLAMVDMQSVNMPDGAQPLSVAVQNGVLCLWAQVDPAEAKITPRTIEIIGTGNPISPTLGTGSVRTFIGTVLMEPFVWHVCERQRL